MTKTVTVKGKVSEAMKARLDEIVAESGRDEEKLVGEAVERLLNDDHWEKEIARRLAVPEADRRHIAPHEMDKWVQSLRDGKSIPAPEAKHLSEL